MNHTAACMYFGIIISIFLICMPSAALHAEIINKSLTDSQTEGDVVEYIIQFSDIPKQTRILEIATDLTPVPEKNLWEITKPDGFKVSGGEESLNDRNIELETLNSPGDSVTAKIYGRVPVLTTVEVVNGVVVTKVNTRKTGYTYYHIQALDENRDILGTAATETFSIVVPDDEQFSARLEKVSNADLRRQINSLYDKGLKDEANELLKYAESPKDSTVSLLAAIIIGVFMLIAGFAGGTVFGQIRAKNIQDFQDEYKGGK
ncbi:hypothetical protein [Methanochimaera problematica]|nr:hypothetical protein [Methanoplanus sp. FWC-SCC4]